MIAELLDLADRLEIPTPRAFEPMPVHYFIDLSAAGEILEITPAFGSTKDKSGEAELGKTLDCPAYFPLAIKPGTKDEIQAAGGGGKSVAEAGHGDVREIFCTDIAGKPPKITLISPPARGEAEEPENNEEQAGVEPSEGESETTDAPETEAKKGKDQYYRHEGWLKQISAFILAPGYRDLEPCRALKTFLDAKHRLADQELLNHFKLPDPTKAGADAPTAEESKTARNEATKAMNAQLSQMATARFTFRVNGELLLKNREFRDWWQRTYAAERERILEALPPGGDGFSVRSDKGSTRLTPVFPHIPKIPGGGNYCPLASTYAAATRSFGLDKHTLSMSLTSSERAAAALKWLVQDKGSNCTLGKKLIAVFWAVPPAKDAKLCPHDFTALLNEPDALQVLDFFRNVHGHATVAPDATQFYCAILSSPKSRITVRGWHNRTLAHVTKWAEGYFASVSLPNVFRGGEKVTSTISDLAEAMVPPKSRSGPPSAAYSRLLETALFGRRLPHSFLESAITRQCLELAKGRSEDDKGEFESRLRARTALAKLYFKTNDHIPMNEHTHDSQNHPAYLCGRVLALLDRIHNAAHGKSTASSPAGRYYGSASSTPALVFPRLCKLARIHLEKVENKNWAGSLDRELSALISKFSSQASWPRTLSLEDQGRVAIGFYYERAPRNDEPAPSPDQSPAATPQSNS